MDLEQYKTQVEKAMQARLTACRATVPQHLYAVMERYIKSPGKRIRPLMLMLTCIGFGGSEALPVQAAAAIEMYHNWTLLHDDIIDHDTLRRKVPTGHILAADLGAETFGLVEPARHDYGRSVAILAGDLLQGLATETLCLTRGTEDKVLLGLAARMSGKMGRELLGGQQLDVEMSHMPFERVNESLIKVMITGKTGAMIRYCFECGTALGVNSLDDPRVPLMGRVGGLLGIAFQLQDDILGLFGDVQKLGKVVGSDIREGKRTLLAVRTLSRLEGKDRERFLALYGHSDANNDDAEEIRSMVRSTGALDAVRCNAVHITEEALELLQSTMPACEAQTELVNMARSMLTREA